MPYYPKTQINTNLYTNGSEFNFSTTKNAYQGYYYEISNGEKYTGKTPEDGPNILLTPQQSDLIIENSPSTTPAEITPLPLSEYTPTDSPMVRSIPQFNPTTPTTQDNQNGQFNRYFCKKNNEVRYLEIDKNTYQQLQNKDPKIAWDLYTPVIVLWIIQGNQTQVYNSNKATVQAIETNAKWLGFSQYFQEKYLKYYLGS
jgi:hypothetical protein